MPRPQVLPSKCYIDDCVANRNYARIIYPDNAEWYIASHLVRLGFCWECCYWDYKIMEITEISEDYKTCWVEEKKR